MNGLSKPMTPGEFLDAMKQIYSGERVNTLIRGVPSDTPEMHVESDGLMEEQLKAFGFGEAIDFLRKHTRWYE